MAVAVFLCAVALIAVAPRPVMFGVADATEHSFDGFVNVIGRIAGWGPGRVDEVGDRVASRRAEAFAAGLSGRAQVVSKNCFFRRKF